MAEITARALNSSLFTHPLLKAERLRALLCDQRIDAVSSLVLRVINVPGPHRILRCDFEKRLVKTLSKATTKTRNNNVET